MVGTNLLELSSSWALNPPKKCPKCGAKVKTFYINLNLDQVGMNYDSHKKVGVKPCACFQ